ncbi:unnamed protein product, partial [Musa hybrid cultivar]
DAISSRSIASVRPHSRLHGAAQNATGPSDEEIAVAVDGDDSPTAKKPLRAESRIPLFVIFSVGLLCIFLTIPEAEHDTILRLTRHLSVLK